MPKDREGLRTMVRHLGRLGKLSGVVYGLAIPALVALLTGIYGDLVSIHPLVFWVPLILMIGLSALTAWLLHDALLRPEVYIELEETREVSEKLNDQIQFLTGLQEFSLSAHSISLNYHTSEGTSTDNLLETIGEICEVTVENSQILFGFDHKELWSMTVYLFDSRDDKLYSVWRKKSKRHPGSDKGRAWSLGNGHVGIAFAQAEAKICRDTGLDGAQELIRAGHHSRPYDTVAYASFVSMPIMRFRLHTSRPYGVLVVTSNVPGRFDQASSLPLRHAASAIAALLELSYSEKNIHHLCDSSRA